MRYFIVPALIFFHSISFGDLTVLKVSGRSILNSAGEEVLLRGVNMDLNYGRANDDPEAPLQYASEEDIVLLADLGCNSIRMCLHWKLFTTEAGYDLIDTYLSWCKPRGIYLILDMHRPPPDNVTGGAAIWNSLAAQDSLCSIWASIAARYSHEPGIAGYDIVNEPSASDSDVWWELANRIADSVRVRDESHILFVESPGGRLSELRLIDDPNTVYSVHCYDPFTVSHAGASWPGDSPVSSNSFYPGDILRGMEYLGWSSDVPRLRERSAGWIEWNSGSIRIPEGVPFVSVKAFVTGDTGRVEFDDFSVTVNGNEFPVMNGDIEELSRKRPGEPANWVFYNSGDFEGTGENTGFNGGTCLLIEGSRGSASWIQTKGYYTAPLFEVQQGDIIRVTGMIRAPRNYGEIALGLDYLCEKREHWDIDSLRDVISSTVRWGRAYQVPIYVGEFGSLPATGTDSRNNLISDWITVMNEEGLHWSFWTFRTFGGPSFGLFYNYSELDVTLSEVLSQGWAGI